MPQERTDVYKIRGNPMTLIGPEIKIGQRAPEFVAVGQGLRAVSSKEFAGKVRMIASVPSLDTGVCEKETIKFNELVGEFGDKVAMVTISMDLPFAQARCCTANNLKNVTTISDYRERDFQDKYGVHVKETGLTGRAVFVIDRNDLVRHVEYVPDQSQFPDFDAAMVAVKEALG
ncbi:MAG: thiol peroxidase [SAR202 cluster bacterium]|nr:thiol peroxidase [SAR202 cluster bacterium]